MTAQNLSYDSIQNLEAMPASRIFALEILIKSGEKKPSKYILKKRLIMKMLQTNLQEVETAADLQKMLEENENVMVCCGRMGPMCIPVYEVMEEIEDEYTNVKFAVMAFDSPEAGVIRNAPECRGFMGLPFTMYYKNGKVVKATSSIQNFKQVTTILDENFGKN